MSAGVVCRRPAKCHCNAHSSSTVFKHWCVVAEYLTARLTFRRARKVQYECKDQVKGLAACYKANNNSRAACFQEYVAFDTCTEEF